MNEHAKEKCPLFAVYQEKIISVPVRHEEYTIHASGEFFEAISVDSLEDDRYATFSLDSISFEKSLHIALVHNGEQLGYIYAFRDIEGLHVLGSNVEIIGTGVNQKMGDVSLKRKERHEDE